MMPAFPRAGVWDESADPFTNTVPVTIGGCAASSASPPGGRAAGFRGWAVADQGQHHPLGSC
jgi:hypothetical protein